jgi:hypothetical protein
MRSFTVRAFLGLLATGALAGGMLLGTPADATAATATAHWRLTVISPSANPASTLTAVACPTSTWCAAAGWDGSQAPEAGPASNFTLAESHGKWSRPKTLALPSDAEVAAGASVNGVACTGKGSCVAVGGYVVSAKAEPAFIAIEQHGIWQRAFRPSLPRNAATPADSVLYAVTCTGPGSCEAAGGYYLKNGEFFPMSVTESGGKWRRAAAIELPPHITSAGLDSIACTHAGSCVAVGSYSTAGGASYVAAAALQVRGHWSRVAPLKLPASERPNSQLNSVSCKPSGQCFAVGTSFAPSASARSMMATLSRGHWSNVKLLRRVPPGAPRGTRVTLSAVSCARTFCLAAGGYTLRNGKSEWIVIHIQGDTWSTATEIAVPAGNPGTLALGPTVSAASCSRSGACAVVGSFQNESADAQALAAISG